MSGRTKPLKCPVCGARFRGTVTCTRCGGDLEPLMRIAATAWRLRRRAVEALLDGDLETALLESRNARSLHDTPSAEKTEVLIQLLAARGPRRS